MSAFLYRFLDEKIYIISPTIFENVTMRVCLFKINPYCLKQLLQIMYKTFLNFLKKLNFHKINSDHNWFVSDDQTIFISVNADDSLHSYVDIGS